MFRVHKVALDLNDRQATYMAKAAGTARFAYNWALAWWRDAYDQWLVDPTSCDRPTEARARLHLNMNKSERFAWMYEVTKCAPQEAVRDLGRAFTNFFAGRASFPVFHRKGERDSFRLSSGFFKIVGDRLYVSNLGWVKMREPLRFADAKVLSVTISKRCGRWFASLACDLPDPTPASRPVNIGGVDVGVGQYATSDGQLNPVPRAYRAAEKKLKRAQQSLARKKKGSKNRAKAKAKLARIHGRIADIRSDWTHKFTRHLVDRYTHIGIEDLNVRGMTKNKRLAKSIYDAAFFEFRRQLEYKAPEVGGHVIVADRWYPSSRLCNQCGAKTKHLPLHTRTWTCQNCGNWHHRDINAAINLKNLAASSAVTACEEFSAPDPPSPRPGGPSNLNETGTRHQRVNAHV